TAMLVTSLGGFALAANLNYLIARSPERAATDITKTCVLMAMVGAISALAVAALRPWIVPAEIGTSWLLLATYVFLFLNLEVMVSYWLAQGRSLPVMVYTLVLTVWRLGTLLGAAFYFDDVEMIFVTIVVAEALKNLAIYLWLRSRGLLEFRWRHDVFREHLTLVAPLGLGSLLNKGNDFGKVVVGTQLGPVPMALYTTAAYQVPLVNIVQTSLSDVIFPDMVKRAKKDPVAGFTLWKRAQTLIFAVICPGWLLLTYYAEPVIRIAFTEQYVAATPFFQVFLLLMLRQCFQFSVPLRSVADNASFATSNAVALVINAALIITLMPRHGLWGPTLGLVVGQMWTSVYLGRRLMKRFGLSLGDLVEWGKLGLALAASAVALAAMYGVSTYLDGPIGTVAGLIVYGVVYLVAARVILREEYGYIMRALTRRPTQRSA
ncbi:MAG TPA: oligosaccharide flippase family protein, partial [Steroidobacteraceae bacterium]|nr:oligosaccharide flippase family protein [Steroidobacteraceae bacterium]